MLTSFRSLYQTESVGFSEPRRAILVGMVNGVVKDVKEKLVAQTNLKLGGMAPAELAKASTAALDIIPEMFAVERGLIE